MGDEADRGIAREHAGERRREAENDEERRPLRENDVLEEVRAQQVVERDRLDRRHEDAEQEQLSRRERGDPPRGRGEDAYRQRVRDCETRNEHERLGIPCPRVRIHAATLVSPAGVAQR